MSDKTQPSLNEAIAAARAGRRDEAVHMLRQVVADDPFNADAWVWLGGVTPDVREQRSALEHALTIQPSNQRAQQGLTWLRERHPEIFDTPSETRPRAQRVTPSYEQRSGRDAAPSEAETQPVAAIYDAPAPHEAPTLAMPASTYAPPEPVMAPPPSQTDRMPAFTPASGVETSRTDRMATVPPPAAPEEQVVVQRSPGANFARWLVILLYLFSFGAAVTLAALTFAIPAQFAPRVDPMLGQFGYRLDQQFIDDTRLGTGIVMSVIAVIEAILIIGLVARGRWAWVINLIIATLIMLGAAALLGLSFAFGPSLFGSPTFDNPVFQALTILFAFTVIFFILSAASRRAFFRRRIQQSYGG